MSDFVFEGGLELRVDVIPSPVNLRRENPYVEISDSDGVIGTFTLAGELVDGEMTKAEQKWLAESIVQKRPVLEAIISQYKEEQGVS